VDGSCAFIERLATSSPQRSRVGHHPRQGKVPHALCGKPRCTGQAGGWTSVDSLAKRTKSRAEYKVNWRCESHQSGARYVSSLFIWSEFFALSLCLSNVRFILTDIAVLIFIIFFIFFVHAMNCTCRVMQDYGDKVFMTYFSEV
jgi:hypothetical protein